MRVIVNSGAGFIGAAIIRKYINDSSVDVIHLDAMTYAVNLESFARVSENPRYHFVHDDIRNISDMQHISNLYQPDALRQLAAKPSVDRPTEYYLSDHERYIICKDPKINIQWPITQSPALSVKDILGIGLKNTEVFLSEKSKNKSTYYA